MGWHDGGWYMHDGGPGWGMGTGMGWGGWLFLLGFLVVVALGVVALVLLLRGAGTPQPPAGRSEQPGPAGPSGQQPEAERILDERFARGEIDEQEYRSRRAVLHAP